MSAAIRWQTLQEAGARLYPDETFKLTAFPRTLEGGRWIAAANADRGDTSANYASFNVDRPVEVYVAYDAAASVLPNWMAGYAATGLFLSTTNPVAPSMNLYAKSFPSGPIVLGGNLQAPAVGATANYAAIVVED